MNQFFQYLVVFFVSLMLISCATNPETEGLSGPNFDIDPDYSHPVSHTNISQNPDEIKGDLFKVKKKF